MGGENHIIRRIRMIKTRLWELRIERGLTLTKLSDLTGIGKSTLNNFENGKRSPRVTHLETLANVLNVRLIDTLFSKDEQISTYVEIVSESIPNYDNMVYNSSIERLKEEELRVMEKEALQNGICDIVCKISDVEILMKILTYVNRMILK